jgi:hypothetical protein
MTKPSLLSLLALLVLPRSIESFGRRGADSVVQKDPSSAEHMSFTGCSGLDQEDHEAPECKIQVVKHVKNVKKTTFTSTKAIDDIDQPDRAFMEHHPYASGVFTIDATLGMN